MTKTIRGIQQFFALALLATVLTAQAVPTIGEPAPVLRGTFFDGQAFDLANYRGKVVLVNFYSSYCGYCAKEIGNLETAYEELKDKGLEVIMVSIERADDRERSARFVRNYSLPGTMAIDLQESGFENKYPTPTCYVIDKKGLVRERVVGAKMPNFYRAVIEPLLKE
jgi:cytochrome c biogenesis protein CcmG, thiol:disulfide interchange protein DsbE